MGKGLNGYGKTWPLVIVAVALGAAAYWQWGLKQDTSPPLSYGGPGSVEFKPAEVYEDSDTFLCFRGIVWHRVNCPSKLTTYLTPTMGERLDLPVYPVSVPPEAGPVDKDGKPKCRPWKAPKIGDRTSQMVFSGFVESLCGKQGEVRIITTMPTAPITINKR